ncbi:MAG: histidine phosphatase family protein [Bacteroidota bacterium]
MGRLLLIRHAQASFFSDNYDQLSEKGFLQARLLGEHLAGERRIFDKVYAGPLRRQLQTLETVREVYQKAGLPFPQTEIILAELSEHSGSSVMRTLMPLFKTVDPIFKAFEPEIERAPADQIKHFLTAFHHFLRLWAKDELGFPHPADLENWKEFRARVNRGIQKMMEENQAGENIIAFSSAGAVSASVGFALNMQVQEKVVELGGQVRNSSITEYVFEGDKINLHAFNRSPHLLSEDLITHI